MIKHPQLKIHPHLDDRLGWRIAEWCRLTGTSRPTAWRHAKTGKLKIVYMGAIPLVPRTEAVRLGFLPPEAA
jgi:hypothetical protein